MICSSEHIKTIPETPQPGEEGEGQVSLGRRQAGLRFWSVILPTRCWVSGSSAALNLWRVKIQVNSWVFFFFFS